MISVIRVEMLGGLSVWADGVPVLDSAGKVNKPWQVFCFLVLNRGNPTGAGRLISALWPDENLGDPANVLKNTIYVLRREFESVKGPKESPILFESGGYLCNPAIRFEVDTDYFEQQAKAALAAPPETKLALLTEAVDLYKGELLPQLENEVWVMPLALYYKQLYSDGVKQLCDGLYEEGRFNELLEAATLANHIDHLEESTYIYMLRALYELGMYRAIIPAYNKIVRIFSEELGAPPGPEIRAIYAAAAEQVDTIEQDIMIIRDDLREVAGPEGPARGPLYCTYDVFKYLYQMVARSSERAGGSVVIVLLTLQAGGGATPSAKQLSVAMNHVKTMLLGGLLRKSDVVARYAKSQYIIMLSVEKSENVEQVVQRVFRKCSPLLEPLGIEPVFATAALDPAG